MGYRELSPAELLGLGLGAPEVTGSAWRTRWDVDGLDAADLVHRTLPEHIDFHTSGSTGPSQVWRRRRDMVWHEAGILAGFLAEEKPEAVVSFVPPVHLYGALSTVLIPAHLGVPAWFRPSFFGAMPQIERDRVVVVATPWIFSLLLEQMAWVRALDHITVLHGAAMLPTTAGDFLAEAGRDRALIVEVLGSTEAGGIATRRWRAGDPPPWTLFPDVTFHGPTAASAAAASADETVADELEVPLAVRSPRIAARPGEPAPDTWETDDFVQPLDERTFRFAGRRNRLVKVNGRRINLDEVEHALRAVVDCEDLAIMPVADKMIGEHVDLLLVLKPGIALADVDLREAFDTMGVRPRKVHVVPRIDRSETGKLRHIQIGVST
jgi:acyl-coenzyme A synthetase/AMP-(fatty) acid ligase